jgi:predicted nucleic-acid-binding protein
MRGVDTNILLRYITQDDPEQCMQANRFIDGCDAEGERLFVSVIVICELAWTLRGPRYRYDVPSIAATVKRLLEIPLFEIESREMVRLALSDYQEGRADLADFMIGCSARRAGCSDTVTLDRRLAEHDGFTLLG